jgi:cobalt/nickel transport system ATP-binding protein
LWGGLDLEVRAGDRVAIVGANGSGKTALLDLLAGWEKPSTGRLTSPPLNERGYVTQFPEYQLFAPTALEDVSFGLTHRGGRGKESPTAVAARANAALAAAGLDPALCARAAPESLSLGERRRLRPSAGHRTRCAAVG